MKTENQETLISNPNNLELIIESEYPLHGTLSLPNGVGPFPLIIIVPGSGNLDRDGNAGKKLSLNIYREMSDFLVNIGFAVFRYDKRGTGMSGGDFLSTGMNDLIQDILNIKEDLLQNPNVDSSRIILLGHSEGTLLCSTVCDRFRPAGLILLAGGGENLSEAVARQRLLVYRELLDSKGIKGFFMRAIKVDIKGEKQTQKLYRKILRSDAPVMRVGLVKLNALWLREHLNNDVTEYLKLIECPVLAATGDKDFQADAEKMQRLVALCPGEAEIHTVKDMNHILKEKTGLLSSLDYKKEYLASVNLPIHPDLKMIIAQWLKRFQS